MDFEVMFHMPQVTKENESATLSLQLRSDENENGQGYRIKYKVTSVTFTTIFFMAEKKSIRQTQIHSLEDNNARLKI